ncbi:hypothetical protein CDD81_4336 [Ophiocordyceps australis]|uniref:Uncharacterized protein n=1 Tax=Ophiocordyceps australis TaxID=1399860 RepID=A0A2C5Y777_9HYPO|nr:hypothetical protein CDD81_4336 [Ophiocordyceps australis]
MMDSSNGAKWERPFKSISVGKCYVQSAQDRFGPRAAKASLERDNYHPAYSLPEDMNWPGPEESWQILDHHDDDDPLSIFRRMPTMQSYRNNLTALSRQHNLYLVAYQEYIYVYVPHSVPTQTLSHRKPELCLAPPTTPAARMVGGYQDAQRPHAINHLIVGMLGTQEVVVVCCDDGDVIAYYTQDVANYILATCDWPDGTPPVQGCDLFCPTNVEAPRCLLHENVGKSAWGLAVHSRSRLIAVTCNRHEITVFAFALATPCSGTHGRDCCVDQFCRYVDSHVRQRARNWRIVISLENASNMPNVCFIDDVCGAAEYVCAIDIYGCMWAADIWTPHQPLLLVDAPSLDRRREWHGWGLVALSPEHFVEVETPEELLGLPMDSIKVHPRSRVLDISKGFSVIPDNPCRTSSLFAGLSSTDDGDDYHLGLQASLDSESDEEQQGGDGEQAGGAASLWQALENSLGRRGICASNMAGGNSAYRPRAMEPEERLDKVYFPQSGRVFEAPDTAEELMMLLDQPWSPNNVEVDGESVNKLSQQCHFLRFFAQETELLRLGGKQEWKVFCNKSRRNESGSIGTFMNHMMFRAARRLSMVIELAELSLVVVGSATGQVMLLTPTRLARARKAAEARLEHGFRIEAILPLLPDEQKMRRNARPLHGVAVAPVQEGGVDEGHGQRGQARGKGMDPRRFRVMLHYRNHDVWTYEIWREQETERLCIF